MPIVETSMLTAAKVTVCNNTSVPSDCGPVTKRLPQLTRSRRRNIVFGRTATAAIATLVALILASCGGPSKEETIVRDVEEELVGDPSFVNTQAADDATCSYRRPGRGGHVLRCVLSSDEGDDYSATWLYEEPGNSGIGRVGRISEGGGQDHPPADETEATEAVQKWHSARSENATNVTCSEDNELPDGGRLENQYRCTLVLFDGSSAATVDLRVGWHDNGTVSRELLEGVSP